MARGGAKRRPSTETKTGKGSAVVHSSKGDVSRVAVKLEPKSDDETDKSEELSDIINFLIETDPRRNREVYGALDASSDDAERSSSPPGRCEQLDRRPPPPPGFKKTPKEAKAPTRSEGALAASTLRIVLPTPDIYGFNYQPDFASCTVPRATSQTTTRSDAKRGCSETSQLDGTLQDVEMSEPCDSAEGSMPANGSDQSFEVIDKCQVPSAEEKMHQKAPASPVNNAVAEKSPIANKGCALPDSLIIKPGDISQDAGDSLADAVAHGPVVSANCDDGRADSGAAPVSPAYPDTRPRRAEEDSRVDDNGSRNDGDQSGAEERQLRTPAQPERSPSPRASDVDANGRRQTELQGGPDVADKPPSSPIQETGGDVTLAECANALLSEDRKGRSSCERDAESDSTEALQWSPGVASRSNSAEYTEEGVPATDAPGNDASESVGTSPPAAAPRDPPVVQVKRERQCSPLLNGADIPECNDRTADCAESASNRDAPSSDRGLDNLFSVFTTVQEGTIVSVDCKKFRKRGRPLGPKKKHALRRAQMAAMEVANRKDDVEFTVRQVLHDVVERVVRTGSETPSKLSEANIKDVISSFCESNGFRRQDFAGDDDGLVFGKVLPDDSHVAVRAAKRRRRGSSDQGSSSEHGSITTRTRQGGNGGTRKRYKKRETSPTKRMLTRSQWRRSCYQKEQEKKRAASTAHQDNGLLLERDAEDSIPDAKRRCQSVDLTSDMDSSNTESSADAMSLACGGSQDMDLAASSEDAACNATGESRSAGGAAGASDGDKARVLVAENSSASLNSSIYLSCEPPKLGYMEASVTTAPRELSSLATARNGERDDAATPDVRAVADAGNSYCGETQGRRKLPPPEYARVDASAVVGDDVNDDDDDDDGESQLVICDTDDSCHGAPPPAVPEGRAWLDDSSADKERAAVVRCELDSSVLHASQRSSRQSAASPARSAVCESEKAAADTGVVCRGDDARTLEATGVAAAAGAAADAASQAHLRSPPVALSVRGSPAAPSAGDGATSAAGEAAPPSTAPRPPSGSLRRTSPALPSRAHHGAGLLHPWPTSLPTSPAAAPSPEVIVVEEEPSDLSLSSRAAFNQSLGLEPLDLSLKEQAFRAKADIPVGKVQPQMATASQSASEEALSNSPINYSSSRLSTGPPAEDDNRSRERERRGGHGSDSNASGSQSAGTSSSEPPSDSILQRLLLDPSRKPKESDSSAASSPVQVILDSRSARGSAETTKDSPKRARDTDIVTEAKSLLNARLTARHQEQLQQQQQQQQQHSQMAKVSNMASVPPMSFPENKLGMSTLESKIVELKKQIHHLTILATYKEKELAGISSLRTAKEDALKQLESKYPGICSVIRAFGTESCSGESSDSPGFTDVPSIVAQAATATTDLTSLGGFPSESDAPLQKKPAVQQQPPALPIPLLATAPPYRLRTNSTPESEHPGRGLLPYDRGAAPSSSPVTARSSVSPRDNRQQRPTPAAPSKSAFSVPSASSSSSSGVQRPPRLLLPKGPVPSAASAASPVAQATASRGATTSALASSAAAASAAAAAAASGWWNPQNGSPLSLTAGLPHHLQREALREYAASSSTAALLKAASVPNAATKQHGGGVPSLSRHDPSPLVSASEPPPSRSAHRRLAEAGVPGRPEDARDVAAELARQQEEFNLALGQGSALAGVASGYPMGRAGLSAAASMYNQAMAYNLYQQLRINKEAAEASALLEKMKQNLPPSQQQQLYQKALLEQAKNRPTAWEHLGHLLQKESPGGMQAGLPAELLSLQPKLSTHELPWLQGGLSCVNCGDPRVKFVCSCCRTQTFCSEQCQVKLWSKLKTQAPTKN
ncbi:hypothetical protein V5799_029339 [Amblyomma americanum]|uniref:MYND-type domain-containing protein n=1 Tax=Amblyomma americanum TaxID=6943 RepID=A0AAQ4ERB2_AMBAM